MESVISVVKEVAWAFWCLASLVFCLAWVWLSAVAVVLWATGRGGAGECAAVAALHFVGMVIANWGTE